MTTLFSAAVLVGSTILSSIGAFLFKLASKNLRFDRSLLTNWTLLFGLGLYGVSAVLTIIAYKGGELTVLVPLGSLNYLWAAFLAQWFLGERMNLWKGTGIGLIVIGISLVGLGGVL